MATKKKSETINQEVSTSTETPNKTIKKAAKSTKVDNAEKKVSKIKTAKTDEKTSAIKKPEKKSAKETEETTMPATEKISVKKSSEKKATANAKPSTFVTFEIRFRTEYGQQLFIVGNHKLLGNNNLEHAVPMNYVNDHAWNVAIDFTSAKKDQVITYQYFVKDNHGNITHESMANKTLDLSELQGNLYISDFWSIYGFPEGIFETKPFKVFVNNDAAKPKRLKKATHSFTVKAPAVAEDQQVCILGNDKKLGEWEVKKALPLQPVGNGNWHIELDLSTAELPLKYKFGLWDKKENKLITLESYEDRVCDIPSEKYTKIFVNEGLINLPENH